MPVDHVLSHLDGATLSLLWELPFAGLLLSIAFVPLFAPKLWHDHYGTVAALSMGAVYFGALTYIGNVPNFMIKAIAEDWGVAMPSFFAFFAWATIVMVPLLAAVAAIWL